MCACPDGLPFLPDGKSCLTGTVYIVILPFFGYRVSFDEFLKFGSNNVYASVAWQDWCSNMLHFQLSQLNKK